MILLLSLLYTFGISSTHPSTHSSSASISRFDWKNVPCKFDVLIFMINQYFFQRKIDQVFFAYFNKSHLNRILQIICRMDTQPSDVAWVEEREPEVRLILQIQQRGGDSSHDHGYTLIPLHYNFQIFLNA